MGRGLAAVILAWTVVGSLSTVAVPPAAAASPAYAYVVAGSLELRAVACSSATICEAVGVNSASQGVVVVVTNHIPGVVQVVPGSGALSGVACPSATVCEAVGVDVSGAQGVVVMITGGVPAAAQTVPIRLFAVACPTAVICQAVGSTSEPYWTQGATMAITNGAPAVAQVIPGTFQLVAVACGSATSCEAVGKADSSESQAAWVAITNGTAGAAKAFAAGLLTGVACPSAVNCQVVGKDIHGVGVVMSIVNDALVYPHDVLRTSLLTNISCTAASLCQAVGTFIPGSGAVVTVTDGIPGPAQVAQDTATLLGITCAGATCEAAGIGTQFLHGVVVTVDPTGTAPAATFTYPNVDDQNNVNPFLPFSWSTVPQAQAYYLIVGRALYGSDLLNSGIIAPTQSHFNMPDLPVGPTIYATLLVEADGVWQVHDSITFTAALGKAIFTYPLDGQTGVDQTKPFQWSEHSEMLGLSFPQAQGYYLAVGTTPYGSDLISVSILPGLLSYTNTTVLPAGRTLYATLFSSVNGTWSRYQTITFTAAPLPPPLPADFTAPIDKQVNADTTTTGFHWTNPAPRDAQGYYLIVGTTLYGDDLVNSGVMPVSQSSLDMPLLPAGQKLFATLFTMIDGSWAHYRSITFTAAPGLATLTYPTNGQLSVDATKPFTWTINPGAQGYYLIVGTTLYGADLVNSGVMPESQTTLTVPPLPTGRTLYATLYTAVHGTWARYESITFQS